MLEEKIEALTAAIEQLTIQLSSNAPTEPPAAEPKATRKGKLKAVDKTETAEEPAQEEPAAAKTPAVEDVQLAMKELVDRVGRGAAKELLTGQFKVAKVGELKAAEYQVVIDAANAIQDEAA